MVAPAAAVTVPPAWMARLPRPASPMTAAPVSENSELVPLTVIAPEPPALAARSRLADTAVPRLLMRNDPEAAAPRPADRSG